MYIFPLMKKRKSTRGKACSLVSNKDRIWECAKPARWNISPFQLLFPCENKLTPRAPQHSSLHTPKWKQKSMSPLLVLQNAYPVQQWMLVYPSILNWLIKQSSNSKYIVWLTKTSAAGVCNILQTIMSHLKETEWKYKTCFPSLMAEQSFPASQPHIFTAY